MAFLRLGIRPVLRSPHSRVPLRRVGPPRALFAKEFPFESGGGRRKDHVGRGDHHVG